MAQVVRQIPTNSQSHAPTTDESGYIDEGYLNNLTRRLGTRPSVQQFNGNNNATREINGQQQGQEEAEDTLSDVSDFDEEWEELEESSLSGHGQDSLNGIITRVLLLKQKLKQQKLRFNRHNREEKNEIHSNTLITNYRKAKSIF
ncbi:unnamed protein product [Rhizophagus irregularis]|nr:unnamed protein product [Rhizophagus irregularis]